MVLAPVVALIRNDSSMSLLKNKVALFYFAFALVGICLSSCSSAKSGSELSAHPTIQNERLQFAAQLSNKLLEAQRKGTYYVLTEDEATSKMVEGLNETLQKLSYQQIKMVFGDYESLQFHEMVEVDDHPGFEIYRFKGNFSSQQEVEVRTVLDQKGRLAGFFVKPWQPGL